MRAGCAMVGRHHDEERLHSPPARSHAPPASTTDRPTGLASRLLGLQRAGGNRATDSWIQRMYVETAENDAKKKDYVEAEGRKVFYKWVDDKGVDMDDYEVSPVKTGWWLRNLYRRKVGAEVTGDGELSGTTPPPDAPKPKLEHEESGNVETSTSDKTAEEAEPVAVDDNAAKLAAGTEPKETPPTPRVEAAESPPTPMVEPKESPPTPRVEATESPPTPMVEPKETPPTPTPKKQTPRASQPRRGRTSRQAKPKKVETPVETPVETTSEKPALPKGRPAITLDGEYDSTAKALEKAIPGYQKEHNNLGSTLLVNYARDELAPLRDLGRTLDELVTEIGARAAAINQLFETEAAIEDLEFMQALSEENEILGRLYPNAIGKSLKLNEELAELQGRIDIAADQIASVGTADKELARLRGLWGSPALARGHFVKHQSDTGYTNETAYLKRAEQLVASAASPTLLTKVRSDGDQLFFDKNKKEFAIKSNAGKIRTLFCPSGGVGYFHAQR
ncbi:MAG: hypothetical protein ACRD0G_05845 [Acidimicrobiales bacterium]